MTRLTKKKVQVNKLNVLLFGQSDHIELLLNPIEAIDHCIKSLLSQLEVNLLYFGRLIYKLLHILHLKSIINVSYESNKTIDEKKTDDKNNKKKQFFYLTEKKERKEKEINKEKEYLV